MGGSVIRCVISGKKPRTAPWRGYTRGTSVDSGAAQALKGAIASIAVDGAHLAGNHDTKAGARSVSRQGTLRAQRQKSGRSVEAGVLIPPRALTPWTGGGVTIAEPAAHRALATTKEETPCRPTSSTSPSASSRVSPWSAASGAGDRRSFASSILPHLPPAVLTARRQATLRWPGCRFKESGSAARHASHGGAGIERPEGVNAPRVATVRGQRVRWRPAS